MLIYLILDNPTLCFTEMPMQMKKLLLFLLLIPNNTGIELHLKMCTALKMCVAGSFDEILMKFFII